MDNDQWTDEQKDQIISWTKEKDCHRLAVSNPRFEYWILLHDKSYGHLTNQEIGDKFTDLMGQGKGLRESFFTVENIQQARNYACEKNKNYPDEAFPNVNGSTVYKLIDLLLQSDDAP